MRGDGEQVRVRLRLDDDDELDDKLGDVDDGLEFTPPPPAARIMTATPS